MKLKLWAVAVWALYVAAFAFFSPWARAVEMPVAEDGTNYWLLAAIAVGLALLCGVAYLWHRFKQRNPEGAAKAQAVAAARAQDVGHVIVTDAKALVLAVDGVVDRLLAAKTGPVTITGVVGSDPAAIEPAKPPAGKLGQPGPLTVQCVGDAAVDVPEFNRRYFEGSP